MQLVMRRIFRLKVSVHRYPAPASPIATYEQYSYLLLTLSLQMQLSPARMAATPADDVFMPAAACRAPQVGLDVLCRAANDQLCEPAVKDAKSKSSPPRERTVGLPRDLYGLVQWAASDSDVIKYVCPDLLTKGKSSCSMGRLLCAALAAFGCHEEAEGVYALSKDPQYNAFEQMKAELQQQHNRQVLDFGRYIETLHEKLAGLNAQLSAAKEEAAAAVQKHDAAKQARLPSADRARKAEARAEEAEAAAKATKAHTAEVERRATMAERELAKAQGELDTLRMAPSRAQARCDAEQARRSSEAAAAARIAELEIAEQRAREAQRQLESKVRSEQIKRGKEDGVLEAARPVLEKAPQQAAQLRNLERRQQPRIKELEAARLTVAEQRAELERLRAQLPSGRGVERSCRFYDSRSSWIAIRTNAERDDAPFNARAIEYQRRLVEEANISFEAAATANALVLAMHHGAPAADRLVCAKSFQNAFYRGGLLDNEREAAANRACPALWSFASDSQKGTQMMVYFKVRCCPPPALPAHVLYTHPFRDPCTGDP